MIVVGFGKALHDCSICVSINGKVKYAKYEREVNNKNIPAPSYWFWKKLIEWNIDLKKIDLLVHLDTDDYYFKYKINALPINDQDFLIPQSSTRKKEILLDHHLAHLWSNTSFNGKEEGVIIDGRGSGGNKVLIKNKKDKKTFNYISPGGIFLELTEIMGISSQEHGNSSGKLMGMINYGKLDQNFYQKLIEFFPEKLKEIIIPTLKSNFHNKFDQKWFDFLKTINEFCFYMLKYYFSFCDINNKLIYSGGVALNIEWNRRLLDMGYKLNIEPHVYDGGLSIGCLRFGHHYLNIEQPKFENFPYIQSDEKPDSVPTKKTLDKVAELLANNKIIGFYQGHGEIGPRALGNRSILMNPTLKDGKDFLNKKVKHREWWRPYGASVMEDKCNKYFDLNYSPYMLFSSKVLTDNLPSITHVDGTCRHQTVSYKQNNIFYDLLDSFEKKTGLPVLLNTSLNEGGKPIAGSIKSAKNLFYNSKIDGILIGNELYLK